MMVFQYFLLVIDVLSHFIWTRPLKSLKATEIKDALKEIFDKQKPNLVRTDAGSEFSNVVINKFLKENNIKHIVTTGEKKANYAECGIKTIKLKLARYMTQNQTHKWYDQLQNITTSYNNTYHSTIKMSPFDALATKDSVLWRNQYGLIDKQKQSSSSTKSKKNKAKRKHYNPSPYKFKVGDNVKISMIKKPFEREYDERWTYEIFSVADRHLNQGIPLYTLKDYNNKLIKGDFYQKELQKVQVDENTVYKIEKVLKKRKLVNGIPHVLVKWYGWPDQYNSFVPLSDIKALSDT